jgi:hypothetical protein
MPAWLKFFDAYTIKARVFPAIIAAIPALAIVILLVSWTGLALSSGVATIGLVIILYVFSDFARSQGKRIEPRIYEREGGKPSVTMMRRADTSLDTASKDRYRAFLARKLGCKAPTAAEEEQNQIGADAFYEQAGAWLRENTRDTKRFWILFNENITHAYRRNLLGLKWVALGLNLIVVAICAGLLWRNAPINIADGFTGRVLVVLVVAAIHAVYIVGVVNQHSVIAAARTYARQLILSTETFLAAGKPKAGKKAGLPGLRDRQCGSKRHNC